MQSTINKEFRMTGMGLHTGRTVTVTVRPANANTGIIFRRTDHISIVSQPALASAVGSTARGTTLSAGRNAVATIEHLMSALHGMGVDNAIIELDGGEIPILDGSARPWVQQIEHVGIIPSTTPRRYYAIDRSIHFEVPSTGAVFDATPSDSFSVDCVVDYPNSVIGRQQACLCNFSDYAREIAPCRTFVFLHEIAPLLHLNLIKGGSLDNALVFVNKDLSSWQLHRLEKTFHKDASNFRVHDGILNTTDPYFPNEPARHKLLDFIGDIRLVPFSLKGHFTIYKPGHKSNVAFANFLMKTISATQNK